MTKYDLEIAVAPSLTYEAELRRRVFLLADGLGPPFGTEDFAILLYSLVRMEKPHTIVELGSAFGVCAICMAAAARLNGHGHVFAVDDLRLMADDPRYLQQALGVLETSGLGRIDATTPREYFDGLLDLLELSEHMTLIERRVELADPGHFGDYPFADREIDMLFSDFRHGPEDVLALLGQALPRMASHSSIFIDSVPSLWPSYLLIERLVDELGSGHVPPALQAYAAVDLVPVVRDMRFTLVHLTERKDRPQCGCSWLRIERRDVRPPTA